MKNTILTLLLLIATVAYADSNTVRGVYIANNNTISTIFLISENYISISTYKNDTYLSTWGGPYQRKGNNLAITVEYSDTDKEAVGLTKTIPINLSKKNDLQINGLSVIKENNKTQDLDGLWRITGRKNGDTINTIPKGDRKTIKLLVDGYFQWIAINPAEKGFYGTGAGIYNFKNGKYTEDIIFFSRDNSRVGHHLAFEGSLQDGKWHHQGKSSKGDPIYEIWSKE